MLTKDQAYTVRYILDLFFATEEAFQRATDWLAQQFPTISLLALRNAVVDIHNNEPWTK